MLVAVMFVMLAGCAKKAKQIAGLMIPKSEARPEAVAVIPEAPASAVIPVPDIEAVPEASAPMPAVAMIEEKPTVITAVINKPPEVRITAKVKPAPAPAVIIGTNTVTIPRFYVLHLGDYVKYTLIFLIIAIAGFIFKKRK